MSNPFLIPDEKFLRRWFAELEPDEAVRDAALNDCLRELRQVRDKHLALVVQIAWLQLERS